MSSNQPSVDPGSIMELLARRGHILNQVANGVTNRCELKDQLEDSRSTVYRGLDQLITAGLVKNVNGEYHATTVGKKAISEHNTCTSAVASVLETDGLLDHLPDSNLIETNVLVDAEIIFPTKIAPNELVDRLLDLIRHSTQLKGFSPVTLPSFVEVFHEQLTRDQLTTELIFRESVLRYLKENSYKQLKESYDTGSLSILQVDMQLPFGLILIEKPTPTVCIVVYGDAGELRGLIKNDTEQAFDWAIRTYQLYREKAVVVKV